MTTAPLVVLVTGAADARLANAGDSRVELPALRRAAQAYDTDPHPEDAMSTTPTPPSRGSAAARLTAAYQRDPGEHTAQRLARAWAFDAGMERLAALRDDPARWSALPQGSRLSVGYYVGAREAAAAAGVDVSPPSDAA